MYFFFFFFVFLRRHATATRSRQNDPLHTKPYWVTCIDDPILDLHGLLATSLFEQLSDPTTYVVEQKKRGKEESNYLIRTVLSKPKTYYLVLTTYGVPTRKEKKKKKKRQPFSFSRTQYTRAKSCRRPIICRDGCVGSAYPCYACPKYALAWLNCYW